VGCGRVVRRQDDEVRTDLVPKLGTRSLLESDLILKSGSAGSATTGLAPRDARQQAAWKVAQDEAVSVSLALASSAAASTAAAGRKLLVAPGPTWHGSWHEPR
jgi:hypothetical protein